ncbi:MAG: cellulase family glycosylhydrolase [Clostridia bacterium]|nr:cellulase family glycosylhydrolase [Clostridia bacterium]
MPAQNYKQISGMASSRRSPPIRLLALLLVLVTCWSCGSRTPDEHETAPPVTESVPADEAQQLEEDLGEEPPVEMPPDDENIPDQTGTEEKTMSAYFDYALPAPGETNPSRLGLHAAEGGEIQLAGKRFCGFGVNYFGAFAHYWYANYYQVPFVKAFAKLKEYGVDFVRMPFGGYWTDYYKAFAKDPDAVLRYLDRVVEEAEKAHIGIIVSLFWHDTALPLYLGEHRSAMGDPESETVGFALDYTAAIVSRYADSPAVWAWEIGNEYNLSADLCDTSGWSWLSGYPGEEPSGFDYYSSDEMITFYTLIGSKIREYDGWRMIETGNGEMRSFAKASAERSRKMNQKKHAWSVDWTTNTRSDFDEMNARMTPDPLNCVCFHLQHGTGDGTGKYVETMTPWGKKVTQREYFTAYKEAADACGKACIFGEMGDFMDMNNAPDIEEHFRSLIDDIRASGIQIALTWQFQDFTDAGNDGMKLRVLGEANAALRADGVCDAEAAFVIE